MSLVPVSKKIPAGICGILLGQFGVHKFIMGFPRAGLVMLGVTIVGYALACIHVGVWLIAAMHIIGFIEGIIYLAKNDSDFYRDYVIYKKEWM
jgi:TM2 domain-containing membrane protein YozV